MKIRYIVGLTVFVGLCAVTLEAAKNYEKITSIAQFDKLRKNKKHLVVWFYRKSPKETLSKAEQRAHDKLTKIYENVAGLELEKDKNKIAFVSVNVAKDDGGEIFQRYNELDEGDMVSLPAILLFNNGKMIDNQMGGAMSTKRIKSYVERYFGIK